MIARYVLDLASREYRLYRLDQDELEDTMRFELLGEPSKIAPSRVE
ncbi:MAG: hypothetical protein ABIQ16_04630 [Polyangiaceae bacterium]